jgi:carbamoyltransferase
LDSDLDLVDIAYAIQKDTGSYIMEKIKEYTEKYNCKNVVISGGYGLNCVSNYRYLDLDINLYVEPISHDGGTSIGAAKYTWHKITKSKEKQKQKTLYYGFKYDVPSINNTSYEEIIDLINDGNPICVFQGKSEAGPRALGNRSILYNPFVENGKNILNELKGREKFRPFAAIVLEEHAQEWFYMKNLKQSSFMMYAVKCKEEHINKIPNVLQVDNTSRIQTVNSEQNYHIYRLISIFYELTGIPMLLNTSFNLAGYPLVETVDDAIKTLKKSNFNYLYFPETQSLIIE